MSNTCRSVAMLAANPALAAIFARSLEQDGGFRVHCFESADALTTFLRISPVALVVLDTAFGDAASISIAQHLHNHAHAADGFAVIALSRAAAPFHGPLLAAGIDEVVRKPVRPAQLLLRIDAHVISRRAAPAGVPYRGVERRMSRRSLQPHPVALERHGNVIPLFGEGRTPR